MALYRGRALLLSIFSTGTTDCNECSGALCSDQKELLPSVSAPRGQARSRITPVQGRRDGSMSSEHTFTSHVQNWSQFVKAEARGYKPWKLLHVDTLMRWVTSLHLALPNGAFMFTVISSFLLPLSIWKGHNIPHHKLPSSAVIKKKKSPRSGQDWHSVQMSEQLKPFLQDSFYLPHLHHLQDCQRWLMKG